MMPAAVGKQKAPGFPTPRPGISREPTESFLQYYHSEGLSGAGSGPIDSSAGLPKYRRPKPTRATSGSRSTSSSEYSAEYTPPKTMRVASTSTGSSTASTRRTSHPSEGGSDRRRLAIVQTESSTRSQRPGMREQQHSSSASLRNRRRLGMELSDLTLMAPPDADEDTYSYLTPPSTAPAGAVESFVPQTSTGHSRSASEAVGTTGLSLRHKSSRDVGIVGTGVAHPPVSTVSKPAGRSAPEPAVVHSRLGDPTSSSESPIFQSHHSRQPSPNPSASSSRGSSRAGHSQDSRDSSDYHPSSRRQHHYTDHDTTPTRKTTAHKQTASTPVLAPAFAVPLVTPEIGQSKQIHDRVAGPVLSSTAAGNLLASSSRRFGLDHTSSSNVDLSTPFSPPPPMTTIFTPLTPASPSTLEFPARGGRYGNTAGPLPVPQLSRPTRLSTVNAPPSRILNYESSSPAPPRPPRLHSPPPISQSSSSRSSRGDLDAVRQALQLPPNVSAALARRLGKTVEKEPPLSLKTSVSVDAHLKSVFSPATDDEGDLRNSPPIVASPTSVASSSKSSLTQKKSVHVREGARHSRLSAGTSTADFGKQLDAQAHTSNELLAQRQINIQEDVSMVDILTDVNQSMVDMRSTGEGDAPPTPTIVVPPEMESLSDSQAVPTRPVDMTRELSWVSEVSAVSTPSTSDHMDPFSSPLKSPIVPDKSGYDGLGIGNPMTPSEFRNNFAKRFSSLPRTPSYSSLRENQRLPSNALPSLPPPMRKRRSQWPPAMHCSDVMAKKTTMERCIGYAEKINELYQYECGLVDWIEDARTEDETSRNARRVTLKPSTSFGFTPQPRHMSRSSMGSEATFPVRADSTLATDLTRISSSGDSTTSPPGAPPILPYPSLASVPARSSSTLPSSSSRTHLPLPISTGKGGFFASLGRKASLAKSGPKSPAVAQPRGLLTKPPPQISNPSISIPTSHTPLVPGGPRAVPYRGQRSQTIMISSPFQSNASLDYGVALARRKSQSASPAVSPRGSAGDAVSNGHDLEFARQVDKLSDLLPHADKQVLAGYLRRSGQDITAIGLYLEDEKLGKIRRP